MGSCSRVLVCQRIRILFSNQQLKRAYTSVNENSKTEVCFYNHSGMIGSMLRVSGEVEFLDDIELKMRVMDDRLSLKAFGLTFDSPAMGIFRISHGEAHFWTMANNLKPKEIISF